MSERAYGKRKGETGRWRSGHCWIIMVSIQEFHLHSMDNGKSLKVLKSGSIVTKLPF